MMPLTPYVRSVIGRGGRSVMPVRNFSSSVSVKGSQAVVGFRTMSDDALKKKIASRSFVSGWAVWLAWNLYKARKGHEEYVIPAMQAKQEAIEENKGKTSAGQ